jgi:hypothetical protein
MAKNQNATATAANENKTVTPPRPSKKVAITEGTATAAPVAAPAATPEPAAPVAQPVATPVAAPVASADVDKASKIADKVTIPATPTDAQVAARMFKGDVDLLIVACYNKRPIATGAAFVEPDKEAKKVLRKAYAAEHNLDLDPEGDDYETIVLGVANQIKAQRDAFNAAAADQGKVDRAWLTAIHAELKGLTANVAQMIESAGGKVTTPRSSVARADSATTGGTERKSKTDWSVIAPKLIDYAESIGLAGVYLVDITVGGYKGTQRPLRLHRDGRFEKCTYVDSESLPIGTGEFVSTWKYFDVEGNDLVPGSDQKRCAHTLTKDEMYAVLAVSADNKLVDTDLRHARYDSVGKMIAGSRKNYIMPTVFWSDAGVPMASKSK